MVDAAARRQSLEKTPLPKNIGELIDSAAADAGDRVLWNFFEGKGEILSYQGMRRATNGIAASFRQIGIGKGSHVAVMLPNIAAFPLTWLALGRIGAVMIPINVGYRPRELRHVLTDSGARFLVIHSACLPVFAAIREDRSTVIPAENTIVVDGEMQGTHQWSDVVSIPLESFPVPEPVNHDDLLNIQYTSGTTGMPKGCMLPQRYWLSSGMVNAFRDGRRYERILASTPFHYMDPQWLLLMSLFQRATLFIAARQSTSRFSSWLHTHRIQFCLLPWVLHAQPKSELDAQNEVIRANVYGVPPHLHAGLEARFHLKAREAFGMTEVGPTLFMPLERNDMVGSGSCGIPCPFRECRVVGEEGAELPAGQVGELLVRGPGIMTGYYNNPDATAAAFSDGWLRTGDLFRQDAAGYFYLVGRKKDSIRRSAENIAAREVETVLNSILLVAESAVIGVPDELRGEEIKAVIQLKQGVQPSDSTLDTIVAEARQSLAEFKVPRYYVFRHDFPRTVSLKIAKQVLRDEPGNPVAGCFDRVTQRWI